MVLMGALMLTFNRMIDAIWFFFCWTHYIRAFKKKKTLSLWLTHICALLLLTGSGCDRLPGSSDKGKATVPATAAQWLMPQAASIEPTTSKLDANCVNSNSYDSCIFKKNPVSQKADILNHEEQESDFQSELTELQVYGIKLSGLTSSSYLQNNSFSVWKYSDDRLSLVTDNLKVTISSDTEHVIEQVMTYYWAERALKFIEEQTSYNYLQDKSIKIFVNSPRSGWVPASQSIYLKSETGRVSMALNADLLIHYLGLAQIYHATEGRILAMTKNRHQYCRSSALGCCQSKTGCAAALMSAVGDYFAALLFPQQTGLGEAWLNRMDGLGFCSQTRNLRELSQLNLSSAFSACAAEDGAGEVHTLGSAYASLWWEVRRRAYESDQHSEVEVDQIFMQHLPLLDGDDDFASALDHALNIDKTQFDARYNDFFTAEKQRLGL